MAIDFMGSMSNIGNRTGASITGNINKAYILFRKERSTDSGGEESKRGVAELAADLEKSATGVLLGGNDNKLIKKANEEGYIPIRVQYNPNTVTLCGRAGELRSSNQGSVSGVEAHNNYNMPEETVLGVELEFDDTNLTDAFMIDSSVASVGGVAGAMKQTVSKDYSVRSISELFVAAMFHPDTRLVIFAWNKTIFWGELTSADVTYTMFNKKGNPIRSKVSIQIRQDKVSQPEDEEQMRNPEYDTEKYWDNAFHNLFESKSGKSVAGFNNKASNIFNLN